MSKVSQEDDLVRGLEFEEVKVPPHRGITLRNHLAVQGALYRGDRQVRLFNTKTWHTQQQQGIKLKRLFDVDDPREMHHKRFAPTKKTPPKPPTKDQNDRIRQFLSPDRPWEGFDVVDYELVAIGGNGMVVSVRVKFENGKERELILKIPVKNARTLDSERTWHEKYKGATHTVQRVDLAALAQENRDPKGAKAYPNGSQVFDETKLNVMILEKAVHGDLMWFMRAVAFHSTRVPHKVLWSMWICMVKMLCSIDYQPSSNESKDKDFEAWLKTAEQNPSAITDYVKDFTVSHHVHFDHNYQNVLLTQDDGPYHDPHPLYKAHDFDDKWSKDMRQAWSQPGGSEGLYWMSRQPPKWWFAPEQVTAEWDDFELSKDGVNKFLGEDVNQGAKVAGRYGSWTNVFLTAAMMEGVITQCVLRHPFKPQAYKFRQQDRKGEEIQTYGWRLAHYPVDPNLLEILVRCQAVEPKDRPTTAELLEHAGRHMPRNLHEMDFPVKEFYDKVFNKPANSPEKSSSASASANASAASKKGPLSQVME